MDGSEDDALYSDLVSGPDSADSESETMVPEEPANMDSDDDFYDDIPLSELQMKLLFEDNGDEEFLGFTPEDIREWASEHLKCECDCELFNTNVELFVRIDYAMHMK